MCFNTHLLFCALLLCFGDNSQPCCERCLPCDPRAVVPSLALGLPPPPPPYPCIGDGCPTPTPISGRPAHAGSYPSFGSGTCTERHERISACAGLCSAVPRTPLGRVCPEGAPRSSLHGPYGTCCAHTGHGLYNTCCAHWSGAIVAGLCLPLLGAYASSQPARSKQADTGTGTTCRHEH